MKTINQLEWFLPDSSGVSPIGPIATAMIEEQIKNGKLSYDDFISCPELKNERWLRIFEFKQFNHLMKKKPICPPPKLLSKGQIQSQIPIQDQNQIKNKINLNLKFSSDFIIHNNINAFKGKLFSIGDQFAEGEFEEDNHFKVGDEIILTVFNSPHMKSFSALSVILDKENSEGKIKFKFYFLRINPEVKRRIHQYLDLTRKNQQL